MMIFIIRMNFTYKLFIADDFGHKQVQESNFNHHYDQTNDDDDVSQILYILQRLWIYINLQILFWFSSKNMEL